MWLVSALEVTDRVLDFSSSGQGHLEVKAVLADGVTIVNAASLLDLDTPDERIQVQICEDCGVTHCQPGGWIALRRVASTVLWIPCFELMADRDGTGEHEYAPPHFPAGLPAFPADQYEVLRHLVPEFPRLDAIPVLRSRAAVRLLQFDAPGRVLGRFPEAPHLHREAFLASELDELLETLIANGWAVDEAVDRVEATPVTCHLDLAGTPAWTPFSREPLSLVLAAEKQLPNSGLQLTWPSLCAGPRG